MAAFKAILVWGGLVSVIAIPLVVAAGSEFLQYRSGVYVTAGFAGVLAMALLLVQPLLASGFLPGLPMSIGRKVHRWTGAILVLAVAVHIAGLWVTSPPDMIDAMTFRAPTAFSFHGVVAMWALVAAALLEGFRKRLRIRPQVWRLAHTAATTIPVLGSVAHALMIEGTMGIVSKSLMCAVLVGVLVLTMRRLRPWGGVWRAREREVRD